MPSEPLQDIIDALLATRETWGENAWGFSRRFFLYLTALEWTILGILFALSSKWDGATRRLASLLLLHTLIYSAILWWPTWGSLVFDHFGDAGRRIADFSGAANPLHLFDTGFGLGIAVLHAPALSLGNIVATATHANTVVGLILLLAFAWIGAYVFIITIQSQLTIAIGPFFVVFGAWRKTRRIADNYIAYQAELGTKLFFVYLLASMGAHLGAGWIRQLQELSALDILLVYNYARTVAIYVFAALVYLVLVVHVPGQFAKRLTAGWAPLSDQYDV